MISKPIDPPADLGVLTHDQVDALADALFRAPAAPERVRRSALQPWQQWLDVVAEIAAESTGSLPLSHCAGHRLIERIGEGAFGVVYRALRPEPATGFVAVKVLRSILAGSVAAGWFAREVTVAARLDDPRIARIYGGGAVDGRPYLVSELLEGAIPITQFCRQNRSSLRTRVRLVADAARGLAHAHQRAVLHRDVKPGNLLVLADAKGGASQVRIVDFGLARAFGSASTGGTLWSIDGWLLGTPAYMAPEQAAGRRDFDVRADVYALGVVLYELVTNALPWHDPKGQPLDLVAQLRAIDAGPLRLPSRRLTAATVGELPFLASELRGEIDWIVARALASSPADRYADAAAFADDLERCLAGCPVVAGPPGVRYALRCWRRRRPAAALAALLALLALLASFVLASAFAWSASHDRALAEASQRAAEDTLQRFDLLAEGERLRRAEALAETLFPAGPSAVPRLLAWIAEHGRPIASRLTVFAAAVAAERDLVAKADAQAHPELLAECESLLARLTEFVERGALPRIASRIDRWSAVPAVPADAWPRALAAVAADPRFAGCGLVPQEDLVPLGADPVSGLQEFAHWPSGDVPARDADGRLLRTATTGIVLVLVPGGDFHMGEQSADPSKPNYHTRAVALPFVPVTPSHVGPFLVGKFEVTLHQWTRMEGTCSRAIAVGSAFGGAVLGPDHPIADVCWWDADRLLQRHGLDLPVAAQWEWAARGGTTTPWWTGHDPASIEARANFADRSMLRLKDRLPGASVGSSIDDGFPSLAPVGSFDPNPFGLYDVCGNVAEWCGDSNAPYTLPGRPRDDARFGPAPFLGLSLAVRGGAYEYRASIATVSTRHNNPPSHHRPAIGLRAARRLPLVRSGG